MAIEELSRLIRDMVRAGRYVVRLHALQRSNERGIMPHEITEALLGCTVVEDYPEDRRGRSCLAWGKSQSGRDLHMVCGVNEEAVWVITVYEPDSARWVTPLKRRAKQ